MADIRAKTRYLVTISTLLLVAFMATGCLTPDQPQVLQSEGGAVQEGAIAEPTPGEELDVAVEDADVEELASGEATGEATEEASEEAAAEEATAEPAEEAAADVAAEDNVLEAEIGFNDVLVSANYFVNVDVENLNGDTIADVDDVLIDLNTGQILYVIVNYGDFLDLTTEDRPMPLSAFGWNEDLELVLRLPEDVLDEVPAVEDEWPFADDAEWNGAPLAYWQGTDFSMEFSPDVAPVRVTQLIGLHAGQLGENLGVVEDLLLDLSAERIAYMGVFTTNDFYDPDFVLLVPLSLAQLTVEAAGSDPLYAIGLLEVDPEVLAAAPALDRSLFASVDFIDQSFTQELNAYWSDQGIEVGASE